MLIISVILINACLFYHIVLAKCRPNVLPSLHTQIAAGSDFHIPLNFTTYQSQSHCKGSTTLVTQLSADRISRFVLQANWWSSNGSAPIVASIAVFNDDQYDYVLKTLSSMSHSCISVAVVPLEKDSRFPVNTLRNIALSFVSTPFLLNIDVDLLPFPKGVGSSLTGIPSCGLILPAFELQNLIPVPQTKHELKAMVNDGSILPFKHQCKNCHGMTQFKKWLNNDKDYDTDYQSVNAEPYFIVETKGAVRFDERFCYGYRNRVSNVYALSKRLRFRVKGDVYLLHLPHDSPSFQHRLQLGCPGINKSQLVKLWETYQMEISK
ncbi:hypothetical protein GEMRC1_008842 [Eukaryota sp. GEM-RC1]